ncbi:MAG: hypothetical protein RMM51_10010 [Verrucomicrobiae bacterium]|nr:hypothetical protein [Verrucomicrobiae bacterium]
MANFERLTFGMFVTFGLYSLLERDAWFPFYEKIPTTEHSKLADRFAAEQFDARVVEIRHHADRDAAIWC